MNMVLQAVTAAVIVALGPGTGCGQVKSDEPVKSVRISGRVLDAGGTPIRDVAVTLKLAKSSDTTASTKTNEAGEYTFLVVAHRSYELRFESPGFRREMKFVTADKNTDVGNVILSVAQDGGPSSVIMDPPVELPASATQGQRKNVGQTTEPTPKLWAAISVPQPIFYQDRIEDLQISFALVNDGGSTVNPNVESSHLFINGVEPQDWSFVISNGPRNEWFKALPPAQDLLFGYQLGPRYFQKPGIYTVRWEGENFKSPELTFRVVPTTR
jgi:hypothetical protein